MLATNVSYRALFHRWQVDRSDIVNQDRWPEVLHELQLPLGRPPDSAIVAPCAISHLALSPAQPRDGPRGRGVRRTVATPPGV